MTYGGAWLGAYSGAWLGRTAEQEQPAQPLRPGSGAAAPADRQRRTQRPTPAEVRARTIGFPPGVPAPASAGAQDDARSAAVIPLRGKASGGDVGAGLLSPTGSQAEGRQGAATAATFDEDAALAAIMSVI